MRNISKEMSHTLDERIGSKMKCKFLMLFVVAALAALLCAPSTGLADLTLGSAQSFAVLGASTVTNTHSTTIYGNLGVSPGSAITGFGPGTVTGGSIHGPGVVSDPAQSDALHAYNTLKALTSPDANSLTGHVLGSAGYDRLTPGVYKFDSSAQLTGALTLDFASNPDADFIFQIGTALTTASSSVVNVIHGGPLSGVYWLMGVTGGSGTGSATLGTNTMFAGNILALDSITLVTGAEILGRAIALHAAVTMDTNTINNNTQDFGSYGFSGGSTTPVPIPPTVWLLGSGLVGLAGFRKRFKKA